MTTRSLDIIGTVNLDEVSPEFLSALVEHGVTIFRLNGAHVPPSRIGEAVALIRRACGDEVKVLVDLPGTKIRTTGLRERVVLKKGDEFELEAGNFTMEAFVRALKVGDVLLSSDGQLKLTVEALPPGRIRLAAQCDGALLDNKGVHLQRETPSEVPFLVERDRLILAEAVKARVDYAGFSYVRSPDDVDEAHRVLAGTGIAPFIKLETREATTPETLEAILPRASVFLIDRGDLASEVGIAQFAPTFIATMTRALAAGKTLFVATQLFMSMCDKELPYLSEVVEFHRLVVAGIAGIQLSEETATGRHAIEVLRLIARLTGDGE